MTVQEQLNDLKSQVDRLSKIVGAIKEILAITSLAEIDKRIKTERGF